MLHFSHIVEAVGIVALAGSVAAAQVPAGGGQRAGGPPPAAPKNLQVLPKDIPRAELLLTMRSFATALGVECSHCHVFVAPGDPTNDFASDSKTPKLVARLMIGMTAEINQKLAANINKPGDEITRVQCLTCHRGATIPVLPPPAAAPGGTPPAPPNRP